MRELLILGTASQVPTRTRNHNGYLLRRHDEDLLFDPGEGTQRQMLLAGVDTSRITRICLTHVHGDHCYGLPGVLSRMALDKVDHPVHLHYPASGEETVRALVSIASPGVDLRLHPHGGFAYGGLEHNGPGHRAAEPIAPGLYIRALEHRIETYGYRCTEPDGNAVPDGNAGPDAKGPHPSPSFAFVMDTAPCAGAEELADGADLLVAECTFSDVDADLASRFRHLTAGQAGELAGSANARILVLTHFSSRYPDVGPLAEQARGRARDAVVLAANDLDRIPYPAR
ncbi:ribonuclease Z [Arthrobacter sp. NyZ413]|uniref:ribonuclease Z n=1 Tax=Arthrobacter sp. NyZ413 TaxID=3144669 RepID=UPI003BF839A3